jgi:hypothetical protein
MTTAPAFTFGALSDGWLEVDHDDLEHPISVKTRWYGATLRIVGLRLDPDSPITSATLRGVPIGQITSALTEFLTSMARELAEVDAEFAQIDLDQVRPGALGAPEKYLNPTETAAVELGSYGAALHQLAEWASPADLEDLTIAPRGRGAKPPTDDDYARFATTYRQELGKGRGAKVRTADRVGINRSTVYRWIKVCQRRALLEEEES